MTWRYEHVRVEALGYALPESVITSEQIEEELAPVYERFGLHAGRLELMTGIAERRFWDDGCRPSEGSTKAGRRALDNAGLTGSDIECLIHTSVSRDFLEPSTASVVHDNLGISAKAIIYDISNACLGFMNGMISLANMIELGQVKRGLIVAGESSRQLVRSTIDSLLKTPKLTRRQLKTAFASLTIGSGAAAMVMSHDTVASSDYRFLGGTARSDTRHNGLCQASADTGFADDAAMLMDTDSEMLLVRGCALAAEAWPMFKKTVGWSDEDIDRSYSHQVGLAHRDVLYDKLGIDTAKDFSTFPFLGNVGSVSLPITMAMGIERDPPPPDTNIALLGIGSGLSTVMLGVRT